MSFQDIEANGFVPRKGELLDSRQDPSQAVAAGIFQINTSVSSFKRLVDSLGTPKDTPELRDKLHKTRQHIGRLAKETSAKLKAASELDHQSYAVSTTKKVGDAKLAKDFEAVLKEFQKAQRIAAERETAYVPFIQYVSSKSRLYYDGLCKGGECTPTMKERYKSKISTKVVHLYGMERTYLHKLSPCEERHASCRSIKGKNGG